MNPTATKLYAMDSEVEETRVNLVLRIILKITLIFLPVMITIIAGLSMLFGAIPLGLFLILTALLSYWFYLTHRVVKIKSIKKHSVIVQDKYKQIELTKEDISAVIKTVRYTFTNRFLLIVVMKKGRFMRRKRYMIFNEPAIDVVSLFKNMGVNLKNFS